MNNKEKCLRDRIYKYYEDNRSKWKKFTLDYFKGEKIHKSTIYRIIEHAENKSGYNRAPESGRIATIMTTKNIHRLKVMFDNKDGVSQRKAARKFQCSQACICKTLKNKTSIKRRKKQKIPKQTVKQITAAKTKCGRLYRISYRKSIILDDESYFTLSHSAIKGNDNFYSSDVSQTPASVKYRPTVKFEKKLLVYICMSDKGISTPVFRESDYTVNKENITLVEITYFGLIWRHHITRKPLLTT